MANLNIAIQIAARDNASGPIGRITNSLDGLKNRGFAGLQTAGKLALGGLGAGVAALGAGFGFLAKNAIDMNATLETSTLQFATLMGSTEQAEAHVRSLFEFAKATPFETGPIIEASRMMQTFGGEVLNTTDNLTLIGDAAAATGAPIDDLGFWVGRLYANLQAGQPFGEAAARLQELAVLSPQARQEMERLQEAGASGEEIFASFQGELGKFNGAMEAQAGTWEGLKSTIVDSIGIVSATALKPFFEMAKSGLGTVADFLSSPALTAGVELFAERFSQVGLVFGLFFDRLQSGAPVLGSFQTLITQIALVFGETGPQARLLAEQVGSFIENVQTSIAPIVEFLQNNVQLNDVLIGLGIAIATVVVPAAISLIGAILAVAAPLALIIGAVALLRTAWENNWGGIQEKTAAVLGWLQSTISTVVGAIQAFWLEHGEAIMAAATTAWEFISTLVDTSLEIVSSVFAAFKAAFEGDWRGFGENLRAAAITAWDYIKSTFGEAGANLLNWLSGFVLDILAKFNSTDWGEVGRNIIQGIANAILGGIDIIKNAAQAAAQAALDAAKGLLGIQSPSKVAAAQVGVPFVQGVAKGLEDFNPLNSALRGLSLALTSGAAPQTAVPAARSSQAGRAVTIHLVNPQFYGVNNADDLVRQLQELAV